MEVMKMGMAALSVPMCGKKIPRKQDEKGPPIFTEQDFDQAMAEAKDLIKVVLEQNNTSEARKLKRRLGKMQRIWKAMVKWVHSYAECSESGGEEERNERDKENSQKSNQTEEKEGVNQTVEKAENQTGVNNMAISPLRNQKSDEKEKEGDKDMPPDPFIRITLCGLPKQLPNTLLVEEIHKQVDCAGQITLQELNRRFKKYERSQKCFDDQKENFLVKLPRFVGTRMINLKYITILDQKVEVKQCLDLDQCYKCWKFGHYWKYCHRATRCRICAGFHHHSECVIRIRRCVNCLEEGVREEDTFHEVNSAQCPLYKKKRQEKLMAAKAMDMNGC